METVKPRPETSNNTESTQEMRENVKDRNPTPEYEFLTMLANGPVWDGNVPSKTMRDKFYESGLIVRAGGWQSLSQDGLLYAVKLGLLKP